MTVSVIVPTYNKAPYIQQALDSVLSQTHKDLEIIVVDDGSTDDTASKLKGYMDAGQITYVTQANLGPSAARNKGLRLARGQYVKFLDSDDFLYPQQIEKQLRDIEGEPEAISVTDSAILRLNGALDRRPVKLAPKEKQLAAFIETNRGVIHAYLVPKFLLERAGGFDESLTCSEDTDLWIRILQTGAYMKHLAFVGCCYRMLKTGISHDTENMFFQKVKIYERLNRSFLGTEKAMDPFLMDCIISVNTKLFSECAARKMDPALQLPHTMKMTARLYDERSKGALRLLYKAMGVQNYLKTRYFFKSLAQKNYRFDLLYHNYSWRYQ